MISKHKPPYNQGALPKWICKEKLLKSKINLAAVFQCLNHCAKWGAERNKENSQEILKNNVIV